MLRETSMDEMIQFYRNLLDSLGGQYPDPTALTKGFDSAKRGDIVRVLRELSEKEAELVYLDFSLSWRLDQLLSMYVQAGMDTYNGSPKGEYYRFLRSIVGSSIRELSMESQREFEKDRASMPREHCVTFDIVDNALCFVVSDLSTDPTFHEITSKMNEAINTAFETLAPEQQDSPEPSGPWFDLASWNPSGKKFQ